MSLYTFLENIKEQNVQLVVVNREAPRQLQTMLEGLFDDQPVEVEEAEITDAETDQVYLVKDGEVVASSSLIDLQESILLINSDLYITGARGLEELELPEVIRRLEGVHFRLQGYPESNKEKLLLITISRYIERLALETGSGKHRASFQRLSRINDEQGTRAVYDDLAQSAVDTHIYGMPDWTPPPEFDLTMHGGWSEDFRDSWFVLFRSDATESVNCSLLAIETERRTWEGFWTFDEDKTEALNQYIRKEL